MHKNVIPWLPWQQKANINKKNCKYVIFLQISCVKCILSTYIIIIVYCGFWQKKCKFMVTMVTESKINIKIGKNGISAHFVHKQLINIYHHHHCALTLLCKKSNFMVTMVTESKKITHCKNFLHISCKHLTISLYCHTCALMFLT